VPSILQTFYFDDKYVVVPYSLQCSDDSST
jgi:hypothetical protein